jgi:hypothetical protein
MSTEFLVDIRVIPKKRWYHSQFYQTLNSLNFLGHTIPKGFVSDGVTVPRWISLVGLLLLFLSFGLHSFGYGYHSYYTGIFGSISILVPMVFPKVGNYMYAAFLHDFLYSKKQYSRAYCDLMFLNALKMLGIPKWRRSIMYAAVRAFGWILRKTREEKKNDISVR